MSCTNDLPARTNAYALRATTLVSTRTVRCCAWTACIQLMLHSLNMTIKSIYVSIHTYRFIRSSSSCFCTTVCIAYSGGRKTWARKLLPCLHHSASRSDAVIENDLDLSVKKLKCSSLRIMCRSLHSDVGFCMRTHICDACRSALPAAAS